MNRGVTNREQIVNFIEAFRLDNDYSPTVREIAKGLGFSTSTTQYHLDVLRTAGYVTDADGRQRTLSVTEAGRLAHGLPKTHLRLVPVDLGG